MRIRALILSIVILTAAAVATGAAARTESNAAPKRNIVQTAVAAGQFKTLVKLVKRAGLAGALSGKAQLTVFAPTDAAFAKVPAATLNALLANKAKLRTVLLYHVVKGRVPAAKVTMMSSATTLARQSVAFMMKDGAVFVNDARVVKANVGARNGIIHVIDKVLIPSS
ncbi:fasciclin domain-containing protein [soil metagenome]